MFRQIISKFVPKRQREKLARTRRLRLRPRFEALEERKLLAFIPCADVTGDIDGAIYGQDRAGQLHWYKDIARDGTTGVNSFAAPNEGNVVDKGWVNNQHIFSGGEGVLYAIDVDGNLRWYRDTHRDGTATTIEGSPSFDAANEGNVIGFGWGSFKKVFSGGGGVIYAIDNAGNLRWYKDVARNGSGIVNGNPTSFTAPNEGAIIGGGWENFVDAFSTGGGNIYAQRADGALLWYKDLARDGTSNFHVFSGVQVNSGFVNYKIFGGGLAPTGERVVYGARQTDGNLFLYKINENVAPAQVLDGSFLVQGGFGTSYLEGYAGVQSIVAGQSLQFYVGATETFNVKFERLHAHFDASGMPNEVVGDVVSVDPNPHAPIRRMIPIDAYLGAGWDKGELNLTLPGDFVLPDSTGWQSGIYAAHLTSSLMDTYIPFVIKPAANGHHNHFAVMVNTNTWNAYNGWGGHSAYDLTSDQNGYGPIPFDLGFGALSFLRPNPVAMPNANEHLLQGELWINSWLENDGYQLDYYTDYDLHFGINGLDHLDPGTLRYDALILNTHPEYYSTQEKAHLKAYLDGDAVSGGSLIYLGGNGVFQAVHYNIEDPTKMETRFYGRTRRENWFANMSANPLAPGEQSQRAILGVASQWDPGVEPTGPARTGAYKIANAAIHNPLFYGTVIVADSDFDLVVGGTPGPKGRKASGWETDQATSPAERIPLYPLSGTFLGYGGDPNPIANLEILAHGKVLVEDVADPFTQTRRIYDEGSDMIYYPTHPARGSNGGFVFSVGSITFGGSMLVDRNLQIITENAMDLAREANTPIVTLSGQTNYTENAPPILFAASSTITDQNSFNLGGGVLNVQVSNNPTDQLAIRSFGVGATRLSVSGQNVSYGGVVIGTWSGGIGQPLLVSLNANANTTNVQALLRNITFQVTGDNPIARPRTIGVQLSDGDAGARNFVLTRITVTAVNDAPVLGAFGGDVMYTENAPATTISSTVTITDVDSSNFDLGSLRVQLSANGHANDRLTIRNVGNISTDLAGQVLYAGVPMGTFTGGVGLTPLIVNFNNSSNATKVAQLLRAVQYQNVSDNPTTNPRTVIARVSDGDGGNSLTVSKLINVIAVNDAPVLGGIAGSVRYTNGAASVAVASAATVSDVDNVNFALGRLTIQVTGGADASNRIELGGSLFAIDSNRNVVRLDPVNGSVVIGTLNLNGGVGVERFEVTFNAHATPAYVQQLIRAVRFRTTNNASPNDRVLSFSLTDGRNGVSLTLTKTIDLP